MHATVSVGLGSSVGTMQIRLFNPLKGTYYAHFQLHALFLRLY